MLFNLIIFGLFAAVAYFHYAQGLFSATLSAILCIFAAALAVSYHEMLTPFLHKLPEQAEAISLVGCFLAAYGISRLVFDKVVPGNVRYPLLMDKIGGGAMGVVAGLFSTGVFAMAAQTMPFGASIGGFGRQDLQDRPNVVITADATANGRSEDTSVSDELVGDRLGDPEHQERLWLHQDDLVLGLVNQLSEPGSALDNNQPLSAAHPDWLTEIFGQRLGESVGVKRVAINTATVNNVQVTEKYTVAKIPETNVIDNEIPSVRGDQSLPDLALPDGSPATLVGLRVSFSSDTNLTDSDGLIRFSPAAIRLKAGNNDYYPVGTIVGGMLLLKDRPDDPLMINGGGTADFLFVVRSDDLNIKTEGKEKKIRMKDGTFLEVKRFAQMDLSGNELKNHPPDHKIEAAKDVDSTGALGGVIRKHSVVAAALKLLGGAVEEEAPSQQALRHNKGSDQPRPSNGGQRQDNEFLPETPGHLMGL
jgi:Colicin V production protein